MAGRPIEWMLRPWLAGGSFAERAGRVLAVSSVLVLSILPSMILYFGIDGWWWDSTVLVSLAAPLGIILFDQTAELIGRSTSRRVRGLARVGALFLGFVVGVSCGYLLVFLLELEPGRSLDVVLGDYRRTMAILVPVLGVTILVGTSLWYRAEAFRLDSQMATASFNVLKGQMQPHFLFNALNALKELIADDPEKARDVTQRIADLYRLIMKSSAEATTPLAEELAIVRSYLEVERVRFGERLRYQIEVPEELSSLHVPSLMLQTLVENAVKHGVAKSRTGGEICVRALRTEGGALELEVWNDGAPFAPPEPASSARTGLSNTRARLQLMYGAAGTLSISSGAGTSVRFVVSGARVG